MKNGHGHTRSNSKTYRAWASMIQRCRNPLSAQYQNYGGRGITVCKQWQEFTNFLRDMGEAPESLTLDRIDNNGSYSPNNCRWVSSTENNRNKRTNVINQELTDRIKTAALVWKGSMRELSRVFAEQTGIKPETVRSVIKGRSWK